MGKEDNVSYTLEKGDYVSFSMDDNNFNGIIDRIDDNTADVISFYYVINIPISEITLRSKKEYEKNK